MSSKLIVGVIIGVLVVFVGIFAYTNTKSSDGLESSSVHFLDQDLAFKTISKENYSGHSDRKGYVIKDSFGWSNLWGVVHSTRSPKPELPETNFNDEMIIAVFQGGQSTGGYGIEITKITEKEKSIEVFVNEKSPSQGSIVSHSFTQPYHIVKTKSVNKQVIFKI